MTNSLRRRVYDGLHPSRDGRIPWGTKLVIVAIVLASLLAILETEPEFWANQQIAFIFVLLDVFFLSLFAVEYVLRLWSAGEEPEYRGIKGRIYWALNPWQLLDLIVIVLFLVSSLGGEVFLARMLRLARIVALLRLGRLTDAGTLLYRCLYSRRYELVASFAGAVAILLIASILLYAVEGREQPAAFGSVPRAMWWAVATLTTVGYGDVYPVTPIGRLLASIVAFLGIGVIAIPAGIVAAAFTSALTQRKSEKAAFSEDASD